MFKNAKQAHFSAKVTDVEKTIWDLEFKTHKVREIKEGIRQQHDRTAEALDAVTKEIAKDHKEETRSELTKQKEGLEKDLAQLKDQIGGLDIEVEGGEWQGQRIQGIVEQVSALKELKGMLESYITTC